MSYNLPDTITITLGGKFGDIEKTVNTKNWSDDTVLALVEFGIKEKANNSGAGKHGDDLTKATNELFDALASGNVTRPGGGGATLSALIVQVRAVLKTAGWKAKKANAIKSRADLVTLAGEDTARVVFETAAANVAAIAKIELPS